ncbi:unnamed protein product [Aphis gossypii]|uniref:Tyrosinase copper-binding domain-containing protein n=1 Tax=Aphis gossypii TaxID=80765 RepID=A0A9P0NCT5_APHGO|nr:unnamed protein product [Aphis gossypii]
MLATAFSIFYLLSFSLYLPKARVASGNTTLPSPHCTNTALPVIILLSEAIFFCYTFHFTDPFFLSLHSKTDALCIGESLSEKSTFFEKYSIYSIIIITLLAHISHKHI